MKIDLRKNPNILRNPQNHADALARRAEILALLEEQDYVNPLRHPAYRTATEQVHDLLAAELDLKALKDAEKEPLNILSRKEAARAEVHRRALIAGYAANAPKEPVVTIPVQSDSSEGMPVTVNHRDEVLTDVDLADHVHA